MEFLLNYETEIRLVAFLGVFILFALLEAWKPRRSQSRQRGLRWTSNLSLVIFNSLILKTVALFIGINAAAYAHQEGIGLFNLWQLPSALSIILSIIILDAVIYWQHRLSHVIPLLWRLHRLHHTDIEYDTTTALRFHPLEIVLSYFIKYSIVLLIGAPVVALILFEIILNASAIFNHANLKLPLKIDRILRLFIVTPDMHRIHHSVHRYETDSNYGFNIPLWDRIFGSYIAQPQDGHTTMEIGITRFRSKKSQKLPALLLQPIQKALPKNL